MKSKRINVNFVLRGTTWLFLLLAMICIQRIYAKELPLSEEIYQQQRTVTGKVMDTKGVPLPGVSVVVKGVQGKGVATDFDGNYSIEVGANDVLVFSYIGFTTQEINVKGRTKINVILRDDVEDLEEVVVVGYGTQKKENLTGAVASVDSKAFEDRPVTNAVQALQGQVAGMNFKIGAGDTEIGGSPSFDVRGVGTIGEGSSANPLVLIDGIEGDLNSINPQDIESISVLKDAASSSIYGSRAAFGVVLVTTKSGKEGKPTITYNQSFRLSSPTILPKMLPADVFAQYYDEGYRNYGAPNVRFGPGKIEKIRAFMNGEIEHATEFNEGNDDWRFTDAWGNTDWYKVFYRDQSPSQEHNLSVRGGSKQTQYFLSTNYLTQEGLLKINTDTFDRYTLNAKISTELFDWFKIEYNTRFTRLSTTKPSFIDGARGGEFYEKVITRWPTFPIYDTNGNYVYGNYIAELNMGKYNQERDILNHHLNLTFTPLKNWNIYAKFSYRTDSRFSSRYYLPLYRYKEDGSTEVVTPTFRDRRYYTFYPGISLVEEESYKSNYFSPNIYSEYSFKIDKHSTKVMAGFQSELNKDRRSIAERDNLLSDNVISINTTDGKNMYVNGTYNHWATAGFFSRLNYDYDSRYLLEVNLRYDGTSRFLRDYRWGWYPSASVGWNIAKERFWESLGETMQKFSTVKLRFSYGELGNQNTRSLYPFYQNMPLGPNIGKWLIDQQKTNTSRMPDLISTSLTWETVATTNFGLDISAFRNKLNITLDIFKRETRGMVGPAPELPGILGTRVPKINNTDMESKGFELVIGWKDRIGKDFNYSINATLTDSRQIVTNYPNKTGNIDQYYSGRELGEIWGLTTHGIAKTDQEMADWLVNNNPKFGRDWRAGDIMYKDMNGDGEINFGAKTLDDPGDLRIIGNSTSRYNFGLDINMRYKGVDFKVFFQGTAKRDLALDTEFHNTAGGYAPNPMFSGANTFYRDDDINVWPAAAFEQHMDYFRPADTDNPLGPNLDAYYPRPLFSASYKNFYAPQTRFLQDGSYIRLKNIQLGYTIPKNITEKIGINRLRFYVSAENIVTWTNLSSIFDPEVVSGDAGKGKMYPLSKVISTGLNLTF